MLQRLSQRPFMHRIVQPPVDALVHYSTPYARMRSALNELASDRIRFDGPATTPGDERLREFVSAVQPVEVDPALLVRVGGAHDGGYVMLAGQEFTSAVSIGIGGDVSWDLDMAAQGAGVRMFDHTIRRPPVEVPGGQFYRLGLGPRREGDLRSLEELIALWPLEPGGAVLKIDVEGHEWASLASVDPALLDRFDQIVMEMHDLDALRDEERSRDILAAVRRLSEGHAVIHVHANNCGTAERFGSYWFPTVIEVSWVSRRSVPSPEPARQLATWLDRPCDPTIADFDLSGILTIPAHGTA